MELQQQRNLQLLSQVEKNTAVTQRCLAKELGVALGLTNLYLKRLARKGFIKITTVPKHRVKYLLTPRGIAEKSRLTYLYLQYSLSYFRDMRQRLRRVLSVLARAGSTQLLIYGTGEMAELAYLTLRETGLNLVGFLNGREGGTFLSCPVWSIDTLPELEFDAVLITEVEEAEKIQTLILHKGIPGNKIFILGPLS